ncbi:hypothetical protein PLAN_40465 [Planktothrix rubescens CCAP 1459/22]|uniref:Uncharacterized protein n=2 Tax=Planktothrix TaxID=54304 RepID=A0A1J1JAZ5_PLAAG|nr:hypothetical protein PLAN_40231 [Planktothrix rubescens NIVA-CYA 18]CAC5344050.1 hypothetical protein PLAN_40465 [Planktothrix rubescens NIVA-CYA 18]CAD0228798.1 conserved hypothetical protein [Planktothrix agardhii]CUM58630.1 protein of unknown function [Planktothrix agardhii]
MGMNTVVALRLRSGEPLATLKKFVTKIALSAIPYDKIES